MRYGNNRGSTIWDAVRDAPEVFLLLGITAVVALCAAAVRIAELFAPRP